jgi:hypothetical protein
VQLKWLRAFPWSSVSQNRLVPDMGDTNPWRYFFITVIDKRLSSLRWVPLLVSPPDKVVRGMHRWSGVHIYVRNQLLLADSREGPCGSGQTRKCGSWWSSIDKETGVRLIRLAASDPLASDARNKLLGHHAGCGFEAWKMLLFSCPSSVHLVNIVALAPVRPHTFPVWRFAVGALEPAESLGLSTVCDSTPVVWNHWVS